MPTSHRSSTTKRHVSAHVDICRSCRGSCLILVFAQWTASARGLATLWTWSWLPVASYLCQLTDRRCACCVLCAALLVGCSCFMKVVTAAKAKQREPPNEGTSAPPVSLCPTRVVQLLLGLSQRVKGALVSHKLPHPDFAAAYKTPNSSHCHLIQITVSWCSIVRCP